jgi:hypothetical protein
MSNTLNGVNLAQIAARSLKVLQARPTLLNRFAANFSPEVMGRGQSSITTRYVVAPTAQDISSGYAPTDVSTVSRTMTLNNFWGYVMGLTDTEVTQSQIDLQNLFIGPSVISTVNKLENLVMSVITNANYSTKRTAALANVDSDTIADMAADLNIANAGDNRVLVILPTVLQSLMKDSSIKSALAFGEGSPLPAGVIGRLHGMDVIVNNNIPSNSENLVGFACSPEAIAVAARGVTQPPYFPGQVEDTVDPVSGLPLQFRYWYDPNAANKPGSHNFSVASVLGYAVGVPGNLTRLVTA